MRTKVSTHPYFAYRELEQLVYFCVKFGENMHKSKQHANQPLTHRDDHQETGGNSAHD
jgi:hypothetical protein